MTASLVISLVLVFGLASRIASGAAGTSPVPSASVRLGAAAPTSAPDSCRSAARAIRYYRARTNEIRSLFSTTYPDRIAWPTCLLARRAAGEWQARAASARRSYDRWLRERGRTIRRLDRALAGHRMAGTGIFLERYGREYGVSPFFIAAVAWTESSLGDAACGPGGFNAWGLGNCGTAWTPEAYSSWAEAIASYARFLSSRWPGHSSPWSFRGYAKCDDCWARATAEHMIALGAPSTRTAYP